MNITKDDRVVGMLWGLHAGDSLGAPWEFLAPSPTWNFHRDIVGGGKFQWRPGEGTDDTDLMLCLLRSINNSYSLCLQTLKREMLSWKDSLPPDIGTTTIRGLENLAQGKPLLECGPVNPDFQGNGSLMRVAPLSLLEDEATGFFENQKFTSLNQLIEVQTKMTHGHEYCVQADRVLIHALKGLLRGQSKENIFEEALYVAQQQSDYLGRRLQAVPNLSWEELATSGFCVDTLCAGFWGLLKFDNFEDSVVAVINRGDDSDSCGAVTGALCGAFYGARSIPSRWLEVLEFREEIIGLLRERNFISRDNKICNS